MAVGVGAGRRFEAQLRYGRHPSDVRYDAQILLFQMTYMTPSRRAFANALPAASGAVSQDRKADACALCAASRTLRKKSMARPSKCSLVEAGPGAQVATVL